MSNTSHVRHHRFRHHLLVIVALLLLTSVPIHDATAIFAQQPSFSIGVLASPDSSLTQGARLRVQQINESGGVRGADGTLFQLQLVTAPFTGENNSIEQAINTLVASNVIAVIGPEASSDVTNLLPQLQALNVPIITPATGDSLIINDQTNLLVRVRATDFFIERALADYLLNTRGIRQIQVMQFDADSTVNVIGFTSAVSSLGVPSPQPILATNAQEIETAVQQIIASPPEVVVSYGNPEIAGAAYFQLRAAGYPGLFTYPDPTNPVFRGNNSDDFYSGIITASTWSYGAIDQMSATFLTDFVRTYGAIPDAIAAAAADAVNLLEIAIGRPGELRSNLLQLEGIMGVQGILSPISLNPGETSDNVVVAELNGFGAPQVVARFAGVQPLPLGEPEAPLVTPTPTPTATPDGVFATIISNVQNVRTGPSTDFEVLGQLEQGEQARVIGASVDYSWLVVTFRGRQGWIANLSNLNEVFGDLNTVPIIASPPTPTVFQTATPQFTATPAPPQDPDIVIDTASVSPNPIIPNQDFTLTVTVRNRGAGDAGTFAIAANMPPNNTFISTTISSLGGGDTTNVTMTGTLQNTGQYAVVIVADLNGQIDEGSGEDNNDDYTFNYRIDRVVVNTGSGTIDTGGTFNLSSDVSIGWNGTSFTAATGQIGIISGISYDNVHYDLISSSIANQATVTPSVGNLIGVLNPDGKRGVLRVDSINGTQVTATYRAYTNN